MRLFFYALSLVTVAYSAEADPSINKKNNPINVLAVPRTPESNTTLVKIAQPEVGALMKSNPIWIQVRADGFALGVDSQFDRANEIANSKMGQTIHVIIDDFPYFPINEPAINPFNEEGYFYNTSYKFEVPFSLKEGVHTLVIFPARSFGESLKGEGTLQSSYFYVGSKKGNPIIDLSKPCLIYNEPSNEMYLTTSKPVLLDFYIDNCELTPKGYQVILSIDGKVIQNLTSWQPYYIYGLTQGKHKIRLQLVHGKEKNSANPAVDIERTITVH